MNFTRPEHHIIAEFLQRLNHQLLRDNRCYFGGGTAIVLKYGEYRQSLDVDFLCDDIDGYRELRTAVTGAGPFCLVPRDTEIARDYTTDAYGIRMFLLYKGQRIKFEIVREGNLTLGGRDDPDLLIPILDPESMFATKLLANADRWRDRAVAYRDAIDLGMLIRALGAIPRESFEKALAAYGDLTIRRGMVGVVNLLAQVGPREVAADTLDMTYESVTEAIALLRQETRKLYPDETFDADQFRWEIENH